MNTDLMIVIFLFISILIIALIRFFYDLLSIPCLINNSFQKEEIKKEGLLYFIDNENLEKVLKSQEINMKTNKKNKKVKWFDGLVELYMVNDEKIKNKHKKDVCLLISGIKDEDISNLSIIPINNTIIYYGENFKPGEIKIFQQ